MPLAAAGVGLCRHAGFTFHLVGVDVLYRPVAAGSLPARACRHGAWFPGRTLSGPLRAVGNRVLHAVSAVCPHGGHISGAGEFTRLSLNQWLDWRCRRRPAYCYLRRWAGRWCASVPRWSTYSIASLFSAKIIFLVIMLALLMPHIHQVNLLTLPVEQGLALSAIPVILYLLWFSRQCAEHRQLSWRRYP